MFDFQCPIFKYLCDTRQTTMCLCGYLLHTPAQLCSSLAKRLLHDLALFFFVRFREARRR